MSVKNYGLSGVGQSVQLGKRGGVIKFDPSAAGQGSPEAAFQLKDVTESSLVRLQIGVPKIGDDAATKQYVDNLVQGLKAKDAVRLASTVDVPLNGTVPLLIDSKETADGMRVLLKDQTNKTENGIYYVSVVGANYILYRTPDADNANNDISSEIAGGMYVFVTDGTQNADTGWVLSLPNGEIELGADEISFTQFSAAGVAQPGAGIEKDGSIFNVLVDNRTLKINDSNKLEVKGGSSGTVLASNPDGSVSWNSLDLSSGIFGATILPVANGGTGLGSYTIGDLLVASGATTLSSLPKGTTGQYLGVDGSGNLGYSVISDLKDINGQPVIATEATDNATDYLTVGNSTTGNIAFSGTGTSANISFTFNPKGNGLIIAKAGYDAYITTNYDTLTDETIVTKGFVESRIHSFDLSEIYDAAKTTTVSTSLSGYDNEVVLRSNGKIIAEFAADASTTEAINGERLKVTHSSNEVQLRASNAGAVGNVDLRLIPQELGKVYFGSQGTGLVKAEDGYALNIEGGDSSETNAAGNIVISGGDSTAHNFNGGDVEIKAGAGQGTGSNGSIRILDGTNNKIIDFTAPNVGSGNSFRLSTSATGASEIYFGVYNLSASQDVSLVLTTKGSGVIKVADGDSYVSTLLPTGNNDALVTKGYVSSVMTTSNKSAGNGLIEEANVFNVKTSTTIGIDASNNVIVSSDTTEGHVLLSSGTSGTEAVWGRVALDNSNAVTGSLGIARGGTGFNSYVAGDLLVGTAGGILTKLALGSEGKVLVSKAGSLVYDFVSNLFDADGNKIIEGFGVSNSVNYLAISNAQTAGNVSISATGTDNNISINLSPKGTGLVVAPAGYTANITAGASNETFVTKGYLSDTILTSRDPLAQKSQLMALGILS